MKPRSRLFASSIGWLLVAAFAVAQDAVTLVRTPKVGDTIRYDVKMDVDVSGAKVTLTTKNVEKVTKVDENGDYTVQVSYVDFRISSKSGDVEATQAPDVAVFKKNGEISKLVADKPDPSMIRIANMTAIVLPSKPVKVGDTWACDFSADAKTGAVAGKSEFKFVASEKVGSFECLKVEQKSAETVGDKPASLVATLWIDVASGTLVKKDGVIKNLPTTFADPKQIVNAAISVVREPEPPVGTTPPEKNG